MLLCKTDICAPFALENDQKPTPSIDSRPLYAVASLAHDAQKEALKALVNM